MASQRISRPSASVFRISTVWPDMLVTISAGFMAPPLGMFSQVAMMVTRLTGNFSSAMVRIAPKTAAAPLMSNFISSMAGGYFKGNSPRVEGNALADQANRRCALLAAVIFADDQTGRLLRALRHRKEGAHLQR